MGNIKSVAELKKALKEGPYVWPGGYPIFFITRDGAALAFKTVEGNEENVIDSIENEIDDGWWVTHSDVNWEDHDLYDDHTGELIESAY